METVVKCEKIKEWNGKPIYGIGLSDGQGGESFKEIPVGTPMSEISITPNPPYGNKVTWNKSGASGGGGYSGGKKFGNESFALSYAKDVVCAGKAETKNLFALADKMYDWLEKKKGVAPSAPVVLASQLPANKPADSSDDLPF